MIGPCDHCKERGQKLNQLVVEWLCMECYLEANQWTPERIRQADVLSAQSDNNSMKSGPKIHRLPW